LTQLSDIQNGDEKHDGHCWKPIEESIQKCKNL